MRTRTFLRRGVLPLSCLALLTVWTQAGHPQPQPVPGQVPPPPQTDLPPVPRPGPGDALPGPLPTQPVPVAVPSVPPAPTVEDLIRQLEQLRKQKADLEKQEKDVVTRLQQRMKDQADRLHKLGIILPAPPPDAKETPDAVTPVLKSAGGDYKGKP